MGSLLFKKDKISIPEAHVYKKLKKLFLHHVSNWKLKWRKINLNLKFLIFVIGDGKLFNSVFSMQIFLKHKIIQINLDKLITQNDRRKKGFKKMF